jgi:hypothetical protein
MRGSNRKLMRGSVRRRRRGTPPIFTVLWVSLALALVVFGVQARRPHAAASADAPGERMVQPATAEPAHSPPPPKPANDRNG